MKRIAVLLAAAVTIVSIASAADVACAQTYPARPIRLIVPAGPGGPNDVLARLLAQHLPQTLGSTVVVENHAGGGGRIGARVVAAAEPDGHTLLIGNTATLANIPAFSKNVGYDPIKSFTAVAKITDSFQVLVVRQDFPAQSVAELIAYAKAKPGKLNFASSGAGNLTHLAGELLNLKTGIGIVHVPYKSTAESVTAILSDQVQLTFSSISTVLPHLRENKIKALAVSGAKRAPELPDVPTMVESGVSDYVVTSFFGVVAPAGTPADIVTKLNAAINEGLKVPAIVASMRRLGAEPSTGSPQEFAAFIVAELKKWTAVAQSSGISID
jgi:tripartite-type tricarboxylate transporter receptor subunit TctC